jgi:hypothetical protein
MGVSEGNSKFKSMSLDSFLEKGLKVKRQKNLSNRSIMKLYVNKAKSKLQEGSR